MGDLHVDPQELRTHAHNVSAACDGIKDCADAADAVAMNADAFGILIGFVGSWFRENESELGTAFRDGVTMLRTDAVNLLTTADDYQNADQRSADRIRTAGGGTGLELPL
jgi:hypothetical protein